MKEEHWKDVSGFEGFYQISNLGRLKSLDRESSGRKYAGKLLSGKLLSGKSRDGYVVDVLCMNGIRKTVRRHRLVAEAFIKNPKKKPEVNHIDGNKENNSTDNLEWATHRENTNHAWIIGLTKQPPVKRRAVIQIYEETMIASYISIDIAAQINQISSEDISKCCNSLRKNAGRYKWEYKEEQK